MQGNGYSALTYFATLAVMCNAYRFVVNGRSGKVRGERPYRAWKIITTALVGELIIGSLALMGGGFE